MKVTVIYDDRMVGVDGVFYRVNMDDIDSNLHAIQWDSVARIGRVELKSYRGVTEDNLRLTSFDRFQVLMDRWTVEHGKANEPPPPPSPEEIARIRKRQLLNTLVDVIDTDPTLIDWIKNRGR